MKRRQFIKKGLIGTLALTTFHLIKLEDIFAFENCTSIYFSPKIPKIAGRKNKCARYARKAAEIKFGKYYNQAHAWAFAENNLSVKKVEDINNQHYDNFWINLFIERGILKPGMIVGAYYSLSTWNNKFYDKLGRVSRTNDRTKKPIEYTHLLCYAGQDCAQQPIFYHQFPYGKKIKQKSIKFNELKKHGLLIKEIIDVKNKSSKIFF